MVCSRPFGESPSAAFHPQQSHILDGAVVQPIELEGPVNGIGRPDAHSEILIGLGIPPAFHQGKDLDDWRIFPNGGPVVKHGRRRPEGVVTCLMVRYDFDLPMRRPRQSFAIANPRSRCPQSRQASLPRWTARSLPEPQRTEIAVPVTLLEDEIRRGSPEPSKLEGALRSMQTIAEGATGNLIAAGIVTMISKLM
jgi:hypothetical protein